MINRYKFKILPNVDLPFRHLYYNYIRLTNGELYKASLPVGIKKSMHEVYNLDKLFPQIII